MNLNIKKIYSDLLNDEIDTLIENYIATKKQSKQAEILDIAKTIKKYKEESCVICLSNEPTIMLVRCGHICLCSQECADMLTGNCPLCRQIILCKVNEKLFN